MTHVIQMRGEKSNTNKEHKKKSTSKRAQEKEYKKESTRKREVHSQVKNSLEINIENFVMCTKIGRSNKFLV